jgi:glycine hydroxymethyltransferase
VSTSDACLIQVHLNFLTGKIFEKVCEACHISINKTPIYGDNGSISPGGVRIG